MRILLIRHAKAEEPGWSLFAKQKDVARELTDEGRKSMRKVAKGLREMVSSIDTVVSSPLVRARQTAEIVADVYGSDTIIELAALAPGGAIAEIADWLKQQSSTVTVALVGHEPDLGQLTAWLLTQQEASFVNFKKGGACLIESSVVVAPGSGKMEWFAPPSLLRRLA